jgi:tetratricopeptide (TPR) repeat protein
VAGSGDALFQEALACERQGKPAKALRLYEKLVAEHPSHATGCVNLGTILYNRRDFLGARRHYELAIRHLPDYAMAHYNLANALEELGDYDGAVKSYEAGARLGFADAHYNLARLLEKIHQPRKALRHWRAYNRLDFGSEWREHAAGRIKDITDRDALKVATLTPKPKRTWRRAALKVAWSK